MWPEIFVCNFTTSSADLISQCLNILNFTTYTHATTWMWCLKQNKMFCRLFNFKHPTVLKLFSWAHHLDDRLIYKWSLAQTYLLLTSIKTRYITFCQSPLSHSYARFPVSLFTHYMSRFSGEYNIKSNLPIFHHHHGPYCSPWAQQMTGYIISNKQSQIANNIKTTISPSLQLMSSNLETSQLMWVM